VVRWPQDIRRADGSVIRFDRNARRPDQTTSRKPVGPRIFGPDGRASASQEPHEDHFASAGGAVMAAKIRKGAGLHRAERPRPRAAPARVRGASGHNKRWSAASISSASPEADQATGGRILSKESTIHLVQHRDVGQGRQADAGRRSNSCGWHEGCVCQTLGEQRSMVRPQHPAPRARSTREIRASDGAVRLCQHQAVPRLDKV